MIDLPTTNIIAMAMPVFIIASPRTGSTALGLHFHKRYPGTKYFGEPDMNGDQLDDFISYAKLSDNYIIKLLGSSMPRYPEWIMNKIHDENSVVITTSRRIVINQIISHYIADTRKTWYYSDHNIDVYNKFKDKPIEIDLKRIDKSIMEIKHDNRIIGNIQPNIRMFYEDFLPELDTLSIKTPYPTNYEELKSVILERYK